MKKLIVPALILVSVSLSGCIMLARHAAKRVATEISPPKVHVITGTVPSEVTEELQEVVKNGAPGVTAIVMKDGKTIFRVDVGTVDSHTRYRIASATKWLTTALAMSVVDEGKLSLDKPISEVMPEFTGEAGKITLRMLLAQTAGLGSLRSRVDIRQGPKMTLAQSAAEIAKRPLANPPGEVFEYGGPQFQVAGAMVEKVTGQRWSDLFDERIAKPLGMTATSWEHPPARGVTAAETLNPLLQGGVVTTANDYMRFLTMIAANGRYEGRQILSPAAIDVMESAQTIGLKRGFTPPGATEGAQYALGNWCEKWTEENKCTLVSSPGAFGTIPWIDRKSGVYGILFLDDLLIRDARHLRKARLAILKSTAP